MSLFSKAFSRLSALFLLKANEPDCTAVREALARLDPPEVHTAYIREKLAGIHEPADTTEAVAEAEAKLEAERQTFQRRQGQINAFYRSPPPAEYTLH
jgi:hypothetical protein